MKKEVLKRALNIDCEVTELEYSIKELKRAVESKSARRIHDSINLVDGKDILDLFKHTIKKREKRKDELLKELDEL